MPERSLCRRGFALLRKYRILPAETAQSKMGFFAHFAGPQKKCRLRKRKNGERKSMDEQKLLGYRFGL